MNDLDTTFSISSIDSSISSTHSLNEYQELYYLDEYESTIEDFDDDSTFGNCFVEPMSTNNEIKTITYDEDYYFYQFDQSFFSVGDEFFV